jgi:hypothetical protein
LAEPLGGGGDGGVGEDVGAPEDCVEPPDVGVELLFELDDGELAEDVSDEVPALCIVEEPPVVEPELVVDVCAKTCATGEKLKKRRMMTETV